MKVLITGGAGFIGSALGKKLIETLAADVVAFDNLLPQVHKDGKRPQTLHAAIELVEADVRDAEAWDSFFATSEPDVIVHFAAETGTGQSLTSSSRHATVNVAGTTEMLDAMSKRGVRPKRILLASSRAVYGEGGWARPNGEIFYPVRRERVNLEKGIWNPLDKDGQSGAPLSHEADKIFPMPVSIYGATKLAQEHVLNAWCDAFSVPLTVMRFQNVYGVGQSPHNPYTGIINIFHQQAKNGQAIEVYEDGEIGRDFVYIDDVVSACVLAIADQQSKFTVYDVGSGMVTTVHDAARIIARMHNAPEPVVCGKFRDGDVRWAVADIEKLQTGLNYRCAVPFDVGAKRVGDWLSEFGYI